MSNKKESSEEIVCECCGKKGAQRKYITRSYGKGATLLVIENIPVISCPSCGETYSGFQFRASCQKPDREGGRLTERTKLKTALTALVRNQFLPCGSAFHVGATAHEIARIKLHRKSLAVERKVPVAAFT